MRQISKYLMILSFLGATTMTLPALAADSAPTNSSHGIITKASDIKLHPAPGFPKGAEIAVIRGDLSKPEPYTIRFKFPDGYVIPSHWHTNDEEVTVLSGTLNVGTGDTVDKTKSTALSAGGFQVVPGKAHHYVYSTGETVIQLDGMGPRDTTFVHPQEWVELIKKASQKTK